MAAIEVVGSQVLAPERSAPTPPQVVPLRRRHRRVGWAVPVAFAVALVVMLRPGAWLGRDLIDPGDPALHVWTLSWGWHALIDGRALFNAPIFAPHHLTLAYSDTLLPWTPVWALFHAITGSWQAATNLLLFSLFAFNLWATYALARYLEVPRDAATIGALGFGFGSFLLTHIGHLQLASAGLLPLAILLALRLGDRPRPRTATALGVVAAATFYVAVYYAVALAVALAVIGAGHLVRTPRRRPVLAGFVLATIVGGVLALPLAHAYIELQRDPSFQRGAQPAGGLRPSSLFSAAPGNELYGNEVFPDGFLPGLGPNIEHRFFPGFVMIGLATVGLGVLVRGKRRTRIRRGSLALIVAAGATTTMLAVGDTIKGHAAPFWYLRLHAPGLQGIRVPARFAVIALLAGALLAAVGYARLTARFGRGPRWVLAAVTAAVVLAELSAPPTHVRFDTRPSTLAVYHALAHRPAGTVLELPMGDANFASGAYLEAPRMVYATIDWHPRVNGYSGFVPPDYDATRAVLNAFPAPDAVALAREMGVRYVVVHAGRHNNQPELSSAAARAVIAALPAAWPVHRYGQDWLVELR